MKRLDQQFKENILYIPGKMFELMNFSFDDKDNLEKLATFVKNLSRIQKQGDVFRSCLEIVESFTRTVQDNGSTRFQLVLVQKYQRCVKLDQILEICQRSQRMQNLASKNLRYPVIMHL